MPLSAHPNVPSFTNPIEFQSHMPVYSGRNELPHRIQPRPLNPELDIHFGRDSPYVPSPHLSSSREPSLSQHVWKESDSQLATVPSAAVEASVNASVNASMEAPMIPFVDPSPDPQTALSLPSSDDEDATKLNEFLKRSGLPTFDFSVLTERNKDQMVRFYSCSNVVPGLHLPHR